MQGPGPWDETLDKLKVTVRRISTTADSFYNIHHPHSDRDIIAQKWKGVAFTRAALRIHSEDIVA